MALFTNRHAPYGWRPHSSNTWGAFTSKEATSGETKEKHTSCRARFFRRRISGAKKENVPRLESGLVKNKVSINIYYHTYAFQPGFNKEFGRNRKNVWRPKLDSYASVGAEPSSTSIAPVLRIWWADYFRAKPAAKVSFWWIWNRILIFSVVLLK